MTHVRRGSVAIASFARASLAASFAVAWLTLAVAPNAARAQEKRLPERTITVAGTGSVQAEPDIALVSTGVLTTAETARVALTQNSAAMRKIIDGLKGAGLEPKDIQTVYFGISPRYTSPKDGQAARVAGYNVVNNIRITVRDVAKVGEILDAVVTLGANQAGGIAFDVSKSETLKDEARKQAIGNALRRAKLLAEAAGAKVGPVITISEDAVSMPPRPIATRMSAEAVPIEAGSKMLEVRVQVTWALE